MSRDNWERLVVAVLRNEELRELARAPSMDPSEVSSRLSFSPISSDLNSRLSFSSPPHEHVPVSHPQAVNKSRAVPFTGSSFVDWIIPKRRLAKRKEKFVQQNGGLLLLQQQLSGDYLASETVTVMVLKVDLQCASCYEKIKTIVCKIPQIRDQIYDVRQNTVTISVVSCNPKKIRDELCCKGGKVIKNMDWMQDHVTSNL